MYSVERKPIPGLYSDGVIGVDYQIGMCAVKLDGAGEGDAGWARPGVF